MRRKQLLLGAVLVGMTVVTLIGYRSFQKHNKQLTEMDISSQYHQKMPREEKKKGREEYLFELLKDPATGKIPINIRERELLFAKKLKEKNAGKRTTSEQEWFEAGPTNVGGRTRALAIDSRDSNVIMAGGVNGGVWKSTDGGESWELKTDPAFNNSVTALAQDKNNPDTWYFSGGEQVGASSNGNFVAPIYSNGMFTSTDNGETWEFSSYATADGISYDREETPDLSIPTEWDNAFRYCIRIVVDPNSAIYFASGGYGIFRSVDGGASFEKIIAPSYNASFSDIIVDQNGHLTAVLSDLDGTLNGGVFRSLDGENWVKTTPSTFSNSHSRSVLAYAPSNPNIVYCHTYLGNTQGNGMDALSFHKIDFSEFADNENFTSEDFSQNLGLVPNVSRVPFQQGSYNMCIAVKPDDENYVVIGATNLIRSRDGFSTEMVGAAENWIGGYDNGLNDSFQYPNHHPDQHFVIFDPANPNTLWSTHDGGISKGEATSDGEQMVWESMNNGYNVTQFYSIAIGKSSTNDIRLMGGAQDNGTPFMLIDNGNSATSRGDVSSGDGAYCYFGKEFGYVSTQSGRIRRVGYSTDFGGDLEGVEVPAGDTWSIIIPTGMQSPQFIHPYKLDPNDENIMYTPDGINIWRNNDLRSIPNFQQNGTDVGWERLTNMAGARITALENSTDPSVNRLYYAAGSRVYKLDNPITASASDALLLPSLGLSGEVYPVDITVNPANGNELIVAFSNYNIVGLYHSIDGGDSFTAIEGNLTGTTDFPGPSIRSAEIMNLGNGDAKYFVGTSIGLFSATELNGDNTEWIQEAPELMGNVVVATLDHRTEDNKMVASTHGRGAFIGNSTIDLNADFIAETTITEIDSTVQFKSTSQGLGLSYSWTFEGGNPASSEERDPVVTYSGVGQFDVTLTVTDEAGNTDTETKAQHITVTEMLIEAVASFTSSTTTEEFGVPVQFTNTSVGTDLSYEWTFEGGEPATSTEENPSVTYPEEGTFDVTLKVTDGTGVSNTFLAENYMTIIFNPILSIEDELGAELSIFPVPTKNKLTVRAAGASVSILNVRMMDIQGKEVKLNTLNSNSSEWVLDVNHLAQGVYFTEIEAQEGVWVKKKFVKQ